MEVGGSHVDDKVLKKDIQFMEGNQMLHSSSNGNLQQMLMMQAMTIEDLLAKGQ